MNRRDFLASSSAALSLGLLARVPLRAQASAGAPPSRPAPPPLVTEFKELRRGVGYFTGRGGTIGWLVNRDAVVVVDSQFEEPAKRFLAGLPGRAGRDVGVLVNTHHHPDHVGGNGVLRPVTRKIVAHEKVPALLEAQARRRPEVGVAVGPDTLFAESWRMEAGDEVVHARYFGAGHTAGDIVVHFEKANVVHLGDLMFNRLYPVMDRPGGTQVRDWSALLDTIARTYPADTTYLFGHGHPRFGVVGTAADLAEMRRYLDAVVAYVEAAIRAGRSKAEVVTLQNLDGFPDHHAAQNSRLPGNLAAVYDELTGA